MVEPTPSGPNGTVLVAEEAALSPECVAKFIRAYDEGHPVQLEANRRATADA